MATRIGLYRTGDCTIVEAVLGLKIDQWCSKFYMQLFTSEFKELNEERGISQLNWLGGSPDLSLIENVWKLLRMH